MSDTFDLIVLGSGHNGLTMAAYCAKRGRKVLVLEKRSKIGGLAAPREFHPGFRTAGVLFDTSHVRRSVVRELELEKFGVRFHPEILPVYAPAKGDRGLLLFQDPERAIEDLSPLSSPDVDHYRRFRAFLARIAPFLKQVFDDFPPDVTSMSFPGLWDLFKKAVSLRMLGKSDMMEILRIAPMCVADCVNEWFTNDLLKATVAAPAIYHTYCGPWSPGSTANLLLAECLANPQIKGGPASLINALARVAQGQGVEIRADAAVKRVDIKDGRVVGVTLEDNTSIAAKTVAASCHPKELFLNMIEPHLLTLKLERNVQHYRSRGTVAIINLALKDHPKFAGRPGLKAEFVRTGEHLDDLERAFDAVKYRQMSEKPVFEIYIPSLEDSDLAPTGQHVMSVAYHFAPYELEGGWTEQARTELFDRCIEGLCTYMPGLDELVLGSEILSPLDLARDYGLAGGHMHHGEHSADQLLVRPIPEVDRYRSPFSGLMLCGSGTHPGGGITCAPGAFAAKAYLHS